MFAISINNSKKEYLFSIYVKLNIKILEEILGIKLRTVHLEKWYRNRKVDMNCINVDGGRLLVEWQMDFVSNKIHYEQIQTLIEVANKYEKTTIVYGSLELKGELICELLKKESSLLDKNIEIVFLKVNCDLLPILSQINSMNEINQIKGLDRLKTIKNVFVDKKGISIYNSNNTVSAEVNDRVKYCYQKELLVSIIKRLRIDSWDISTNVYQFKRLDGGKNFTLGSNFDDITFRVFCSRKATVGVSLVFSSIKTKKLFYNLLEKKAILDSQFNFILKWDERYQKIESWYPISWFYDREMMINRICREIKMYLTDFNDYIKQAIEECTD